MAAQERHSAHLDAQALGEALGTRPATVRDVAYGEGQLYSAGRGAARLEVFPRSGVTRLTAQDLRVELFGTADAAVSDTGVEFHRSQPDQQASLTVIPGGGVVFTFMAGAERTPTSAPPEQAPTPPEPPPPPSQGPQTAQEPTREPASPPGPPPRAEAPSAPLTAAAGAAATESPTARPAVGDAEPEQVPRVQLTGRLGRDPTFRTTTKTGTLVGRFPLAEHHDDGTTRWHTVLAVGDRAHQLQRRAQAGELAQGREVDVVGYLHTTTRPGRDGRPRTVQEVYATAVTRH